MLQEIAVVARDLDDERLRPYSVVGLHVLRIVARVRDPTARVRREIRVLGAENRVGCDILVQLNEETPVTDEDTERVERLHFVQVGRPYLRLAQRRQSEVDERMSQYCAAESASDFDVLDVTLADRL